MKQIFFVLSSIVLFTLSGADLVRDGKAQGCIVLEKNAPPPVVLASSEIASYVKKITGTDFPVVEKPSGGEKYVIRFQVKEDSSLGKEGYRITGKDNALLISGSTPRGVLYGACAFIEEFFGVRWLAPGELYEYVPSTKRLSVPDSIARKARPVFSVRGAGFVGCNWNSDVKESWKYLIRNRWQVHGNYRLREKRFCRGFAADYDAFDAVYSGGGHCLLTLVPDKLFDAHPEYFALVKGKRIRQTDKGRHISQPCTSNPEVIALAIKGVTEYFDKSPKGSTYLIGNNDVQTWCECENCQAQDTPEEKKKGYVSTRFFKFINAVAEGVHKKHPDAKIQAWGYQNYRFAPKGVKPDPTLRINLCDHQRCYRHSLLDTSCKQNDMFRDMFLSWRAYSLPVTERGYQEVLLGGGYFYLPIEYVIADDLRYFQKIGVDGYEYLTTPPDGTYGKRYTPQSMDERRNAMYCLWPSLYICGKMFWDTALDPEKIWEDAGKHFYGKAWSAMKEYRELLRKAYTETAGHIIYSNPPVDVGRCLQKPGVEKKLLALLDKAEKLAAEDPDPKVAKRLALEKKYFLETWIKNAREFEKTLSRTSFGVKTSEKIVIDGTTEEKSWGKAQYIAGFSRKVEPPAYPADLFMKVLYDKEFLYLALSGTSPVPGEKWFLRFPDHANLDSPAKEFDLDGETPFEKSRKERNGEVCYEIRLPRSLANLSENAATFLVNGKRVQSGQICAELYQKPFGSVTLGREGLANGLFADVEKVKKTRKNVRSEFFPKKWGLAGSSGSFGNGVLTLNGVIYQYMNVNGGEKGGILNVDAVCAPAGKGKGASIRPYLSLCVRRPGDRGGFRHEIKKYGKKTAVPGRKVCHFSFALAPYENGYFYLEGTNAALESVTASFEDKE